MEVQCRVLRISRAGYYVWLKRGISKQASKRQELLKEIKAIHKGSRGTYGSPRVQNTLKKKGIHHNHKTVEKIMKENGISARRKKKFKVTTDSKHKLPIAENVLNRQFQVAEKDKVYVSDITYVGTEEGWLYLAVFIDLYSRKVLGWSMSPWIDSELVLNAFRMAIAKRGYKVSPLVHSDRGSQYASDLFVDELRLRSCNQSMSRKGNCWDNAVMERFFGSLKTERTDGKNYISYNHAKADVIDYIEGFYNNRRLHSTLNYLSPIQYEQENRALFN